MPPTNGGAMAAGERLTIAKFTSQYRKNFPAKFIGPNEDLKFSKGDRFRAHSVKQSTLEYDNGLRENISTESSIPFAILFDLHNNTKAATNGYKFRKISDLVQLPSFVGQKVISRLKRRVFCFG